PDTPKRRGPMFKRLSGARSRFMTNIKDPNGRKNAVVLLAGKLLGVAIVLVLMTTIFPITAAHAQDGAPDATAQINAINTSWTLIAAFLVFCMQVGFEMLEAGFARSRESINILVEGIADTCICGITFWAFGFAFMFCAGTPFIGT